MGRVFVVFLLLGISCVAGVPWSKFSGSILELSGAYSDGTSFSRLFPDTGYAYYSSKVVLSTQDSIQAPVKIVGTQL